MSEQIASQTEPTQPAAQTSPAQVAPTSAETVKTGGKTFTEQEVESILKDRLDRERAKREKAAQEAAERASAEAAAKNGEWEKVAKANEQKLAELQAALKARELADLRRSIAEKIGLPVALASRLMGETEKEIEEDAKSLLETLPKPAQQAAPAKPPAGMMPANPGANATQGESAAQQRARIHGAPTNPFDPTAARNHGGGAFYTGPKNE